MHLRGRGAQPPASARPRARPRRQLGARQRRNGPSGATRRDDIWPKANQRDRFSPSTRLFGPSSPEDPTRRYAADRISPKGLCPTGVLAGRYRVRAGREGGVGYLAGSRATTQRRGAGRKAGSHRRAVSPLGGALPGWAVTATTKTDALDCHPFASRAVPVTRAAPHSSVKPVDGGYALAVGTTARGRSRPPASTAGRGRPCRQCSSR